MVRRNYCVEAQAYATAVLSGEIPACDWVKKACKRQLDDLANGVAEYRFDERFGNRVCRFIEYLPHTKGELAGKTIHLEPWQCFILTTVFGWVDRENHRRFQRVYIEVPRGNGKSALSSGVGLYMLTVDGEPGAEVYSFATTRDQAAVVFDAAQRMVQLAPKVAMSTGMSVQARSITVLRSGSKFEARSADAKTLDGLNTHFACIDELHAHKTRGVYDVVETSIGKRVQPLLWVITTAGFDTSGICFEVRDSVRRVLNRTMEDETQFGIIYTVDESDEEWWTEEVIRKANPNWGVSVMPKAVLSLAKKAKELPSAAANFKTKHLDIWCSAASAWMDMPRWNACAREGLNIDDFSGLPCVIGLDLGAKSDLTAKVKIFKSEDPDSGRDLYCVFPTFYLPRHAVENETNSQYRGWADLGYIRVTEGAMTDLSLVEEELREDLSMYDVQAIAYDPWQAVQLAGDLANDSAPMVEYRNTVQNISEPMKTLEALVKGGQIVHDGNPVMSWMMSNVEARPDFKDNIFPRKALNRPENKIDGVVATIYALAMLLADIQVDEGDMDDFVSDMIIV